MSCCFVPGIEDGKDAFDDDAAVGDVELHGLNKMDGTDRMYNSHSKMQLLSI